MMVSSYVYKPQWTWQLRRNHDDDQPASASASRMDCLMRMYSQGEGRRRPTDRLTTSAHASLLEQELDLEPSYQKNTRAVYPPPQKKRTEEKKTELFQTLLNQGAIHALVVQVQAAEQAADDADRQASSRRDGSSGCCPTSMRSRSRGGDLLRLAWPCIASR
ncbi:hypothetical protein LY76DRAFT_162947 [Colletotrichum caudatum]|nr:hypothetical protein LY76DRAFT_162947 [Colletotrichum caudatum]